MKHHQFNKRITNISNDNFASISAKTLKPLLVSRHTASSGYFSGNSRRALLTSVASLLIICAFSAIFYALPTHAAATLSISVNKTSESLEIIPTAGTSTFSESGTITAYVTTTNYTGYKLTITGPNEDGKLVGEDENNILPTIEDELSKEAFSNVEDTTYDNTWGFLPSKLNGAINTNYQPSPLSTTATIIDTTNAVDNNTYDFSIAVKVNTSLAKDSYSGNFTLALTANPAAYQITYDGNGATANVPASETGDFSNGNTINISSISPTRTNYTFAGWCTGTVTNYSTCSGTTIASSGTYTFSSPSDTALNTLTLTAIWKLNYSVTYNASTGGSGAPSSQSGNVNYNGTFKLSTTAPIRSGYDFNGWCTVNPSGGEGCSGTAYSAGQTITVTSPVALTLYARWKVSKLYLQDVSTWKSQLSSTGDTLTAYDRRDEKSYLVGKLADGKIWMLDNLAFDGTSGDGTSYIEMNSTNTNITGTLTWSSSVKGMTADHTNPKIYVDGKNNVIGTATLTGESTWKYGVLYNFAAASAGSIIGSSNSSTTSQDICPKGWRLPTGGSSGEYQALATAYSSNVTNVRNALHLPLSGSFYGGSLVGQGSGGNFWSSTARGATSRYYLFVDASGLDPQSGGTRQSGCSVRCVAP